MTNEAKILNLEGKAEYLSDILEKKDEAWDWTVPNFKAFRENREPEAMLLRAIHNEIRYLKSYTLSDLSTSGDVFTMQEFVEMCEDGGFIDSDGNGYYVKDGKKSDLQIKPSDIKIFKKYRAAEFDSVVWYNK